MNIPKLEELENNDLESNEFEDIIEDTPEINSYDNQPCYWIIEKLSDETIRCRNERSGNKFTGTMAEFNEMLERS